jgi:hypothetical protein
MGHRDGEHLSQSFHSGFQLNRDGRSLLFIAANAAMWIGEAKGVSHS